VSTLTATEPAQPNPDTPAPQKNAASPLWARYIGAMPCFMGAALIAGGVVHYPIDPPQYAVLSVIGALVFALGTVFNEFVLAPERPPVRRAIWVVTVSLFLSFGVGLTGGCIQHFDQVPEHCAIMTPLGLAMS
jgi:drug/metabolite transporter (DMT)-like permease